MTAKQFTLLRDNDSSIRFTGTLIGHVKHKPKLEEEMSRWTELKLHLTASGKYVCSEIVLTTFPGEMDRHTVKIFTTKAEVVKFFGYGWLAKELYDAAGIEYIEDID